MPPAKKPPTIEIPQPMLGEVEVGIVGDTPIVCNRMAEKARRELLLPAGRKTTAQKATSLKHDVLQEFRDSPDRLLDDEAPTLIAIMASAVKRAMRDAAVDVPGAAKAQIGRLAWIPGEYMAGKYLPLYGVPQLFMSVTRQADINRTPDIRTRTIVPRWAVRVPVRFVTPQLTATSVINLLATAGLTIGLGDWRPEKGSGTHGQFHVCNLDDPEFQKILGAGGRGVQEDAMADPAPYDADTAELLTWFDEELERRGRASAPRSSRTVEVAA